MNTKSLITCPHYIFSTWIAQTLLLFDARNQRYYRLERREAKLWRHVAVQGEKQAGYTLLQQMRPMLSPHCVREQVDVFLDDLMIRGLLVLEVSAETRQNIPLLPPSLPFPPLLVFGEALFFLHWFNRQLQAKRFYPLLLALSSSSCRATCSVVHDHSIVQSVCTAVQQAAQWCSFPARCLHQSLVVTWMLQRRNIKAHLVLGVHLDPFTAHAWVTDDRDHPIFWHVGLPAGSTLPILEQFTPLIHTAALKGGVPC